MSRGALLALALLVATALSWGCPPPTHRGYGGDQVKKAPPPADAAVVVAKSSRGNACTPGQGDDLQGTCDNDQMCLPMMPGGYCLSFCGAAGTACDGTCADSARGGEVCLASCDSDADCRTGEGYLCDPVWKACALPSVLSPKFAACDPPPAAGTTFAAATQLTGPSGPGLYHHEPAAAIDGKGNLVGLYIAGTAMGRPNPMGLVRVLADGTVEADGTMPSDRDNNFDPWIAVDRAGNLHAVWLAFNGGRAPERDMQIAYSKSSDGGASWSAPIAVQAEADCPASAPGCVDKPMIAIGRDASRKRNKKAEAIYVFYSSTITEGMRMVASRDGGKTFGTESVPVFDGAYGDVTVDDAGTIHVVAAIASPMAPFGSTDHGIEYTRSTDGGLSFATPELASESGESIPFYFVNPTLVSDGRSTHVAYASGGPDGIWKIVLASQQDGKPWTRRTVSGSAGCNHSVPNLALDARARTLHVTWAESSGGGSYAHSACPTAATAACAAPAKVSSQAFASYSFARHATKWTGEYASLIVDDKRGAIHALWSQTVDEGGQPIARIFHAVGGVK